MEERKVGFLGEKETLEIRKGGGLAEEEGERRGEGKQNVTELKRKRRGVR